MKLIICEKPSLARNVKNAVAKQERVDIFEAQKKGGKYSFSKADLSGSSRKQIFYRSSNYLISSAFGHLFSRGTPENYIPEGTDPFDPAILPIIPEHFKLFPKDDSCREQFFLLKALIELPEVEEIVNCGDADREGEIIIRDIIALSKTKKPVSRLWLPEQTEPSILAALDNLESDSKYDDLAQAGYARTYVDWLFGYDLSMYLMRKINARKGWGAGRVIIPIVDAVYRREQEIKNFVSAPYWQIGGDFSRDGITVSLTDKPKFPEIGQAQIRLRELQGSPLTVKTIEKKKAVITPPKLFSLDTLQGKLSKDFGMTLDVSMPIIQKLYESGFITYPRTNTEYLAENENASAYEVVDKINSVKGYDLLHCTGKRIFDSSKIESHSAIRPTVKFPEELSETEQKVYSTVFDRFCAVFAPPCEADRTTVTFICAGTEFSVRGDVQLTEGFRKYEPKKSADEDSAKLPMLEQGESIDVKWKIGEKQTKAPPRYTVESLLEYLKAPFRREEDVSERRENDSADDRELYENIKKGMELGTSATRTAIITNAVKKYGYMKVKENKYYCTEKGEAFISYLHELNIDLFLEKNVRFGMMLKNVENGTETVSHAVKAAAEELMTICRQEVNVASSAKFDSAGIGNCPYCGSDICDGKLDYYCSGYRKGCGFKLWKKSFCIFSFSKNGETVTYTKEAALTKANAKALLKHKQTTVTVPEKNGTKGKYKVRIEFDKQGRNKLISLGKVFDK